MIVLSDAEYRTHDRVFILLDKTPGRDGQTDGQTESLWLL